MGYSETAQGPKVRLLLTEEEMNFPAIDDLAEKTLEWLKISKVKTRANSKKADLLYDEIMSFKLPQIKFQNLIYTEKEKENSVDSGGDSSVIKQTTTRSLRPRAPSIKQSPKSNTCPSTPTNQRIRANLRQPASGTSSSGSSSVLSAALNQQHPSVSVTKIRQLLRADSAQKKQLEERERQERLRSDRKVKEERAEAQKKQLLEERAHKAKLKREERLLHAAEVRKAREEARRLQKLQEETKKVVEKVVEKKVVEKKAVETVMNETFKKPAEVDNIEINIPDETTDEQTHQDKVPQTADWARSPYLREALIKQFSKPGDERRKEIIAIFPPVKLPADLLEQIFGKNTNYKSRTSSAIWLSPANRSVKRTSSESFTPVGNEKRAN